MLQIKNICKEYRTGNLVQKALNHVSLNLRDNEFVAILGPSGSGKTTLLNIIGGLDRYDSGDLIINGISTKKYRERDWDSYRNHTIGFVFQSYNLIPHQTILANVELALTISGIGKIQRRQKALEMLEKVGLGNQIHKRPNQLSGGQMQRVAIARALVNDPDILLADEPTGALDSNTSVQVMELLKEVAKERLVVMVTHNPELAEQYATRIVNLRDGVIQSDSNVFEVNEKLLKKPKHQNMGKASMSLLTALSLSFNNLKTKKARTLLTSFAGSIGIIGIALILSLSTGVNQYIKSVEEDTLSEYPLQIQSTGFDMTSMMVSDEGTGKQDTRGDVHVVQMVADMFSTMDSNDLESLKKYLDSGKGGIEKYTNAVEYSYNAVPQIYRVEEENVRQVHPDKSFDSLGFGSSSGSNSLMSSMMSTDVFYKMPAEDKLYKDQYNVKAGRWPNKYNECVLVLTSSGSISDFVLYTLGLRDPMELDEMIRQFINEENIDTPQNIEDYSFEDILGITFKLVNSSDYYEYDDQYKVWKDKTGDKGYMQNLVEQGEDLKIVGIVQPEKGANASALTPGIGYPASLTKHVAKKAQDSQIVKEQLANPDINVFTNEAFGQEGRGDTFDMNSLFQVDESKMKEAFGFDTDAFSLALSNALDTSQSSLNLADMMDFENMDMKLPDMPSIRMEDLFQNLDLTVSSDQLSKMIQSLMEGYQEYATSHPEADYSGLVNDFSDFLGTEAARKVLLEHIRDMIQSGGEVVISTDQLKELIMDIMKGYQEYALEHGYVDAEKFDEYFLEYLQTSQAKKILQKWVDNMFEELSNISITPKQLQELAEDMTKAYLTYAEANGLPDPRNMGKYFMEYLATPEGEKRLFKEIEGIVDTKKLEEQLAAPMEEYVQGAAISMREQISQMIQQMMGQMTDGIKRSMSQTMALAGSSLQNAVKINGQAFADALQINMDEEELLELMLSMDSAKNATYENNLKSLGYVDFRVPTSISIYPKDFESKEQVIQILNDYNSQMEKQGKQEQVITFTDVVGTLMFSVTDIIDVISYVLIAFVAISLIVSSIMIGVITYISVLERQKEIGILRAIGASRGNVSQVFNAETFIIGLCAGLFGIGITCLLLIPGNALIHYLAGTSDINAILPAGPAVVLILLSIFLTLLGGLIPSRKASKSDPVTALRTE